jgi:photosystem II PsbU protein
MKKLVSVLALLTIVVTTWGFWGQTSARAAGLTQIFNLPSYSFLAATERRNVADDKLSAVGNKIDLNNSDIRDFRQFPGFYPSLAGKIIRNAPYDSVDDVLKIPGLSESQKERLQATLDNFTVTAPESALNEGDDRYNPGVY